jgi:hypothetical protein
MAGFCERGSGLSLASLTTISFTGRTVLLVVHSLTLRDTAIFVVG